MSCSFYLFLLEELVCMYICVCICVCMCLCACVCMVGVMGIFQTHLNTE
jgi:hypothetical protein